jgi:4-hydroxymandelate oxidase
MAERWLEGLPERARAKLPTPVWRYVEAGAGDEATTVEATRAWGDVRLHPRALAGVGEVSLATSLLGTATDTPLAVAPTSMQRSIHPDGEQAMVAGAEAAGALVVVPSNAGTRFAELGTTRPWWLQAYLPPRRDASLTVWEAARDAGAAAIVLTVDTPFPGTKYGVDDADWADLDLSWWRCNFTEPDSERWAADLTLDDVTWLRDAVGLPVVVKGVLRADDARACVDAGAAAIWVSNHGGRQLDRAVSTAVALPDVAAAVGEQVPVYADGGIRSGLDALVALALGADAVFVGRPALHALADGGAQGVTRLLRDLADELREALHLAGCATPAQARTAGLVAPR